MTAVRALLRDLRLRGVVLARQGDHVRVEAPRGAVTEADQQRLREAKSEVTAALAAEDRLLNLSCAEFERQRVAIEVRFDGLADTLWLVPRTEDIGVLVAQGVKRGRIWTAHELADLLSLPRVTRDDFLRLACLKVAFGAVIVSVTPDAGSADKPPSGRSESGEANHD